MAETIKRLGAVEVLATTNTALYTVPAGKHAVVNVKVCNKAATDGTFRVAHIDAGGVADINDADYMEYDAPIEANGSAEIMGITMGPADTILVYGSSADLTFIAHGSELT